MASSFKIKLKLPPNPNQTGVSLNSNDSPQRSSVPAEGSSVADGGSSVISEDNEGEKRRGSQQSMQGQTLREREREKKLGNLTILTYLTQAKNWMS